MINAIIDGISIKLNESFGDEYEIYTESVKQGLKNHCFIISCVNPTMEQFLGKRYFKTNMFCIHYFPSSAEPKNEINAVTEQLFLALEYITVDGDLIRGTKMRAETDDAGILNFFINYDLFVHKVEEEQPPMESYDYDSKMKG